MGEEVDSDFFFPYLYMESQLHNPRHKIINGSCITSILWFIILFMCSSVALMFQIIFWECCLFLFVRLSVDKKHWNFPDIAFQKFPYTVSNLSLKCMIFRLVMILHLVIYIYWKKKKVWLKIYLSLKVINFLSFTFIFRDEIACF